MRSEERASQWSIVPQIPKPVAKAVVSHANSGWKCVCYNQPRRVKLKIGKQEYFSGSTSVFTTVDFFLYILFVGPFLFFTFCGAGDLANARQVLYH